ncbi:MAG TPA: ATP-binding protein [Candidatus Limnocylindrales bacterium]
MAAEAERLVVDASVVQSAFDAAPAGLGVVDRDLRFVVVNETLAAMNGVAPADHVGRRIDEILPQIGDSAVAAIRRVLETGSPLLDVEVSGETNAEPGERREWLESFHPIRGADGSIVGIVASVIDVTDRARRARAQQAFIDVLSHEMRTPITTILAGAQLLTRGEREPESMRQLAAEIADEAARLNRLVENLIVLSRIERGVEIAPNDPVLVQHVLERVVAEEQRRHGEVTFVVRRRPDLPPIGGDEGYLEQIVRNLVSNAVKYGRNGGTVEIEAELGAGEVVVRVCDDGPGFIDGDEERVFELFYRGPRASRRASGAGIGLYVVRSLVETLHGRTWAATRPDGGAELGVAFPVMDERELD